MVEVRRRGFDPLRALLRVTRDFKSVAETESLDLEVKGADVTREAVAETASVKLEVKGAVKAPIVYGSVAETAGSKLVNVPVPQNVEGMVEVVQTFSQEGTSERAVEPIVDVPMPQVLAETVKVIRLAHMNERSNGPPSMCFTFSRKQLR